MKVYLLLLFTLLSATITNAQEIEINLDGLFIDSHQIEKNSAPEVLRDVLGQPDRVTSKFNDIWTYDTLGLRIYIQNSTIRSVSLDFIKEDYDFSPKQTFSGVLKVFENQINQNTSVNDIRAIDGLQFEDSHFQVYAARSELITLTLQYLESIERLEAVGITFR